MFEGAPKSEVKKSTDTTVALAEDFAALVKNPEAGLETKAFEQLETVLFEHGYTIASSIEVGDILRSEHLLCRSEQFSKVIDLVEHDAAIPIVNPDKHANMCTVSSGSGFRVAMLEGFSGKDVGGVVKVVVTFSGEHIAQKTSIPREEDLWQTKPETAAVSLIGAGEIFKEDVEMLSFRFPVNYFPETHLTDEEKDRLEEEGVSFIVRHYVPHKNAAPSYVS